MTRAAFLIVFWQAYTDWVWSHYHYATGAHR
jgi:hypothetical protein